MKRVVTAFVLALWATTTLTTGTAASQESGGTGTVKGKATLTKKGIPEASVVLKPGDANAPENESLTAKTSSKGTYKITNVPPGAYKAELTTTVVPKKDRDSGAVGANVNWKIKGYSILSRVLFRLRARIPVRSRQASWRWRSPRTTVSVKAGGTKTVNISIKCPSGITVVGSSS
jgi:hypothetical protein